MFVCVCVCVCVWTDLIQEVHLQLCQFSEMQKISIEQFGGEINNAVMCFYKIYMQ